MAGFRDPEAARRAMIVVGMRVMLDVFMAKNVHIAGEAVSLSGFSSCNCFIALSPMGVAALPIPSISALMVINIELIAG
jgi:hypothetical protein